MGTLEFATSAEATATAERKVVMKIPDYMLYVCREMNLDPKTATPREIVEAMTAWEFGTTFWASKFAQWMRDAGCKLEDLCT